MNEMNKINGINLVSESDVKDSGILKGKHSNTECYNDPDHNTKIDKQGHPCWYKRKVNNNGKFDKNSLWDGKNYLCSACYQAMCRGKDIGRQVLHRNDFDTRLEYANARAQKLGYKDEAECAKIKRWERGVQRPIEEAKDSGPYFGVCIGEKYVSQTFDNPKTMPYGNPYYDWICKNGLKIQHEARCLCKSECATDGTNSQFKFTHIDYNKVADVFILSGWKDRESLEPLHIWAFKKDDIVRREPFWMRDSLSITNSPEGLAEFNDFEVTNRLDKLKEICNKFRKKE